MYVYVSEHVDETAIASKTFLRVFLRRKMLKRMAPNVFSFVFIHVALFRAIIWTRFILPMVLSRRSLLRSTSFSECSLDCNEINKSHNLNIKKSTETVSCASSRSCPTQIISSYTTANSQFNVVAESTSFPDEDYQRSVPNGKMSRQTYF